MTDTQWLKRKIGQARRKIFVLREQLRDYEKRLEKAKRHNKKYSKKEVEKNENKITT